MNEPPQQVHIDDVDDVDVNVTTAFEFHITKEEERGIRYIEVMYYVTTYSIEGYVRKEG